MKASMYVFELDRRQILGKDVSNLFSSWNIEEIYLVSFFHTFSDVVVPYSNVFRSLFLSGIGCQKDRSLVITVKRNFWYRKTNFAQERFDPRYLPGCVGHGHVFGFCGRQCYSFLSSGQPRDRRVCQEQDISCDGLPIIRIGCPITCLCTLRTRRGLHH